MNRPDDVDEIRLVAVLSYLGKSQDEVREILHVGKGKVGEIQAWIKSAPLTDVEAVLDEPRLNKVVLEKLSDLSDVDPRDLVRAARVTADDLLGHYRQDYLVKHKESEKKAHEPLSLKRREHHQRDMRKLVDRWRSELNSSFFGLPVRDLKSRESLADAKMGLHVMSGKDSQLCWQLNKGEASLCYPLEIDVTPETRILCDYLHAHLRSGCHSWLLNDHEKGMMRWKLLGGQELMARTRLLNRIEREVRRLSGKPLVIIATTNTVSPGPTNWFGETIVAAALDGIYDSLDYHPVESVSDDVFKAQYGSVHIGYGVTREEAEQYLEWHKELMTKYRKSKAVQATNRLRAERESISKEIYEALTGLVVNNHVPGTCSGCQ